MSAATLWFLVLFSSVNGGYAPAQVGPFGDRPACERALASAKDIPGAWFVKGVCVADRMEPK